LSTGVEEHALFAELVELAQWCHGLRDVDISRTEELANRLSVLHLALIDQIEDAQPSGPAHSAAAEPATKVIVERARGQSQELLAAFATFVAQLRNGPSPFGSWAQICDRLDEVVVHFRRYAETESELSRASETKGDNSAR
jgi:hypothetical protein